MSTYVCTFGFTLIILWGCLGHASLFTLVTYAMAIAGLVALGEAENKYHRLERQLNDERCEAAERYNKLLRRLNGETGKEDY